MTESNSWKQDFEMVITLTKEWAAKVFQQNNELLSKIASDLGIDEKADNKINQLQDEIIRLEGEAKIAGDLEVYKKYEMLWAAAAIFTVIEKLTDSDYHNPGNAIFMTFILSQYYGMGEAADLKSTPLELIEKRLHSKHSGKITKKGRWEPFQEKRRRELEEFKAEIEQKYYADGKRPFHHEVWRWLNDNPENKELMAKYNKHNDIPLDVLRKAVAEIADKYGCKWGAHKKTTP